ncbi:hypothetical protein LSM04_006235 [Trypanosoma melophagium]|uniref:uncharacterized protein n=1 Tax=Trypanosoma melophagium TaxID=715481 RepID=UPI00351A6677|nr:hypothetical protein LSM04_006235 [Trypanosoma melophagium]
MRSVVDHVDHRHSQHDTCRRTLTKDKHERVYLQHWHVLPRKRDERPKKRHNQHNEDCRHVQPDRVRTIGATAPTVAVSVLVSVVMRVGHITLLRGQF